MAAPVMDLTTTYTTPPDPVNIAFVPLGMAAAGPVVIDINETEITDGENSGILADILKVNEDDTLVLDSSLLISDGDNEAPFDFKYDSGEEVFGAGTAFLRDSE